MAPLNLYVILQTLCLESVYMSRDFHSPKEIFRVLFIALDITKSSH